MEEGIPKDILTETEGSLEFYVDQRTTQRCVTVFGCPSCRVEVQPGDAEAAEEEDDAMEQAAQDKQDHDPGERQAQVQLEEEALLAADDGSQDELNLSSFSVNSHQGSPRVVLNEEEEGVEETE